MILKFWGTRGSFPVAGRHYLRFGGTTSCASLEVDEETYVVVDAGTGIRKLGESLAQRGNLKRIFLFLTHFHLDHVSGLPSFAPLYDSKFSLTIYSPLSVFETRRQLDRLMGGRFFPVSFSATGCQKEIRPLRGKVDLGPLTAYSFPLPHPQGNVGLRFERDGCSVVFATDAEPLEGRWSKEVVESVREAACLIAEGMFTPEEYRQGKKGWGHGTWRDAVTLAREARCRQLILSHWNPGHEDGKIKAIINAARQEYSLVYGARPGLKLKV